MMWVHQPRKQLRKGSSEDVATARKNDADNACTTPPTDVEGYFAARRQMQEAESRLSFDHRCRQRATLLEQRADAIIHKLRRLDDECIYAAAAPRMGYADQMHQRFAGDHFLSNADLISKTALFDVARRMPKGGHLHIHFNACLPPEVLLGIAKTMERMFIMSSMPLLPDDDFKSYQLCELQFSIMSEDREARTAGDLFSREYQPWGAMRLSDFLERLEKESDGIDVNEWLYEKLVFGEMEAHGPLQTASGAWEKFNARTRMMKGLFNYETAYRRYTRLCLEDFVADNIQYAEIRPNFMTSNQLYCDDGSDTIDNKGIMQIIIDEVAKFQADMAAANTYFAGIKVIYCTPRSLDPSAIKAALDECIEFKKTWPECIAGFDLVGEESPGRPIRDFIPELLSFQATCRAEDLDIPFLFHCGETLEFGDETDGNLYDALLLNAKRIGHGFALPKHPLVMQRMREKGVCVELCPISNEILGLTPRVSGHAMYPLLANDVHCTVSSDNGALFRSTLSHDFYQVLVGKADMGLYGWKQLVLWSIEHSCLGTEERTDLLRHWEGLWTTFLEWLVEKYGDDDDTTEQ